MKINAINNPVVKNILSVTALAGFGYILSGLTLFPYASFVNLGLPIMYAVFVVFIGLISWFILRLKLAMIYKAIYMMVPLAVVFLILEILLIRWPVAVYTLSTLFAIGVFYYFYRTKQPWLYYCSLIFIYLYMLGYFTIRFYFFGPLTS